MLQSLNPFAYVNPSFEYPRTLTVAFFAFAPFAVAFFPLLPTAFLFALFARAGFRLIPASPLS